MLKIFTISLISLIAMAILHFVISSGKDDWSLDVAYIFAFATFFSGVALVAKAFYKLLK